jgi:hypothetical protein
LIGFTSCQSREEKLIQAKETLQNEINVLGKTQDSLYQIKNKIRDNGQIFNDEYLMVDSKWWNCHYDVMKKYDKIAEINKELEDIRLGIK